MITGEIISTELDANKNIIIWIAYAQDGVAVEFYRPIRDANGVVTGSELLIRNERKVWPLYARFENFIGQTPEMVSLWIQRNVEAQIGSIIREIKTKDTLNTEFMAAIDKLKGTVFSSDTAKIPVDLALTGEVNAVVELKDDGTYQVV